MTDLDNNENIENNNDKKNNNHIIPLKWYGQYITNNKNLLDASYKENDFKKLYNNILNELYKKPTSETFDKIYNTIEIMII